MPNRAILQTWRPRCLVSGLVLLAAWAGPAAAQDKAPLQQFWTYKPRELSAEVTDQPAHIGAQLPPSLGAGGGGVFYASPRDHRVLCLEAATGKLRWEFTTGGPVREAPGFWDGPSTGSGQGKVYFASDDGWAYCLDAASGKVIWKHPPPADRCNIAYGKIVSAWPVRTNVLVHEGVAYFASGIFPHDGGFVTAVDAKTGALIWQNAASAEYPHDWGALSPIGLLTIAHDEKKGDRLLVANEGMGGKPFRLSDGFEFHREARKHRQSIHIVGARDGDRVFGISGGQVVCKGPPGAARSGQIAEAVQADALSDPAAAAAADAIIKQTGVNEGYALVLDCRTGAVALELARKTKLVVYAIFRDEAQLEAARRAIQPTGMYGVRVTAHYRKAGAPIEYPPYFADLIVCESAMAGGNLPAEAGEIARLLKPLRGVALIGSTGGKQSAEALKQWAGGTGVDGWKIVEADGRWAKCVRGALAGAGAWTHQNADPGNSMCSYDEALKPPLGVVWYGGPIANEMVNRVGVAPLIVSGVLVSPGANVLEGYDQYTGRRLWRREMKRVSRTNPYGGCGNLAANSKDVFVAYGHQCFRIDLWTGKTIKTYNAGWGWIACDEKRLYGSQGNHAVSKAVFAIDLETGQRLWNVETGNLQTENNTIAMGDGAIYFIMDGYTDESRKQAVDEMLAYAKANLPQDQYKAMEAKAKAHDTRILVAVNIETGKIRYERGIDVTDCGGATADMEGMKRRKYPPALIYRNGLLAHYNASAGGKYWGNWVNNNWAWRGIAVRKAEDGSLVWFKPVNFRGRVVLIDETLHADPWALNLRTGEFVTRKNPVTGKDERWVWCRYNKHCGIYVASKYFLFGRSGGLGYHDLLRDNGLYTFLHSRPSCWFDTVSGGGLMIKPPQSFGCTCEVIAPFTFALGTVEQEPATPQVFSAIGPTRPVKHLYVDFGAMGDHRDPSGNLYLADSTHRGPPKIPMLRFNVRKAFYEGGRDVVRSAVFTKIENTDVPFAFATTAFGLKTATIPLAGEGDGQEGVYHVALGFAAPPGDRPGQRIFDVKLQGRVVLKDFDVAKEAGGADKAVWKEFDAIKAGTELTIELGAKGEKPTIQQMPIINAAKILRR